MGRGGGVRVMIGVGVGGEKGGASWTKIWAETRKMGRGLQADLCGMEGKKALALERGHSKKRIANWLSGERAFSALPVLPQESVSHPMGASAERRYRGQKLKEPWIWGSRVGLGWSLLCAAVHGVAKSPTRLSDWTKLNCTVWLGARSPFPSDFSVCAQLACDC